MWRAFATSQPYNRTMGLWFKPKGLSNAARNDRLSLIFLGLASRELTEAFLWATMWHPVMVLRVLKKPSSVWNKWTESTCIIKQCWKHYIIIINSAIKTRKLYIFFICGVFMTDNKSHWCKIFHLRKTTTMYLKIFNYFSLSINFFFFFFFFFT